MTAIDLLADLQARGVVLTAKAGKLGYDAPRGGMTPNLVAMVRQHKAALLALLQNPVADPVPDGSNAQKGNAPRWRLDDKGRVCIGGMIYAPTTAGGWVLVHHPKRRMVCPGTLAVLP
jgi:hypothetical protein